MGVIVLLISSNRPTSRLDTGFVHFSQELKSPLAEKKRLAALAVAVNSHVFAYKLLAFKNRTRLKVGLK